jgi:hypothetical protein
MIRSFFAINFSSPLTKQPPGQGYCIENNKILRLSERHFTRGLSAFSAAALNGVVGSAIAVWVSLWRN